MPTDSGGAGEPPSRSAREILAGVSAHIGTVPGEGPDWVCPLCFGPIKGGYPRCFSCHKLFFQNGGPEHLHGRVVPMSTAVNPGAWYSRFPGYKGLTPTYRYELASLGLRFIQEHEERLEALLGGPWDFLTVVPSTKPDMDDDEHPLLATLRLPLAWKDKVEKTLTYAGGERIGRGDYRPQQFEPAYTPVDGRRVIVVEDLWVSGSKSVSAAGRLVEEGAASLVVLPLAREFRDNENWTPPEYREATEVAFDVTRWPRQE